MAYVDGYVIPVPEGNKEAYRKMAEEVSPLFKEFGALRVVECWDDDVPTGEHTDFYKAVKAEEGEKIVFSWIVWPSKEVRDAGWEKMQKDERMQPSGDMPFDGKRMFWGGFTPIFDSDKEL
ncbi:MAG: DUF1428 domain-containing protein [Sphingomonadaceae bacterium]